MPLSATSQGMCRASSECRAEITHALVALHGRRKLCMLWLQCSCAPPSSSMAESDCDREADMLRAFLATCAAAASTRNTPKEEIA